MSAAMDRRGAKTRLIGVMILFLGLLDAMLSWRGGFALNTFPVVLIGAGLFIYTIGAIRRSAGQGSEPRSTARRVSREDSARTTIIALCGLLGAGLFGWSEGHAAETSHQHAQCDIPVRVTDEAEGKLGGALYVERSSHDHAGAQYTSSKMKGAPHMVHKSQHGGAFFMAPNKLHHLEGLFSAECGFRLFFYNAFTEPIAAGRFLGFIWVTPNSENEPDVIRFLKISKNGTTLWATIGDEITRPLDIQLYVAFPESDEPQLFNISVSAAKN